MLNITTRSKDEQVSRQMSVVISQYDLILLQSVALLQHFQQTYSKKEQRSWHQWNSVIKGFYFIFFLFLC